MMKWGNMDDFWSTLEAKKTFPLLQPLVRCIQTIPVSVTQVDSAFSSMRAMMNARRGKTAPETLRQSFMLYRNKDMGNRLNLTPNEDAEEEYEDLEQGVHDGEDELFF